MGYCGRLEEPAILVFSLILHMRSKYVASIRFGLPLRIDGMHRKQSNHARLYLLSSETYAKRCVGARLLFASILPALPNLWLTICVTRHLATLCCLMVLDMAASTDCNDNDDDDDDISLTFSFQSLSTH